MAMKNNLRFYFFSVFVPGIFLVLAFLLFACRTSPAVREDHYISLVFVEIKAESPVEKTIFFSLNLENPFPRTVYARIANWQVELNEKTFSNIAIHKKEKQILMLLHDFPSVVKQAGDNLSPALIANYAFDLAKEFNGFYQDIPVLKEENQALREFRLVLSEFTANVLKNTLGLLGITAPEKM